MTCDRGFRTARHARRLALSFALATALAAPAGADGSTTRCKAWTYWTPESGIPYVTNLRAIDLPRLTDGYAPRCLVADTAAGRLHRLYYDYPARIRLYGASWDAGRWRVRSRFDNTDYVTRIVLSQGERRIKMTFAEPGD